MKKTSLKVPLSLLPLLLMLLPIVLFCTSCAATDPVPEAGKIWCDCVEANRLIGKSNADMYGACTDEMRRHPEFEFFEYFENPGAFDGHSEKERAVLNDQMMRWAEYRANNCPVVYGPH